MSLFVDMGKFIYILSENERDPLILDKSEEDFNYKVGILRDIRDLEGSSIKDKVLLGCYRNGLDYNVAEKWLNMGLKPSCMLALRELRYPPVFDTSDFTKDEVKGIIEYSNRWREVWRAIQIMNNLLWTKEFLRKGFNHYDLLSYVENYKEGLLTIETFLTFNAKRMDEEILFMKRLKVAEECENTLNFPYEWEEDLGDYVIVSPKSYRELVEVGDAMNNCLGEYPRWVVDGHGLNRILFMKEKGCDDVLIAIEVQGIMVAQALKKDNKLPLNEEKVLVDTWIEEHGFFKATHFNRHGN